ncbi:MAG: TIGR03560 family F420-dependent LLM class oxidoreductase [Chloroflexota bacterium]|nr:TIGR03560 family F420-dependent LLM class oxidoreductase [Chloroflexota bacterium]
MIAIGLMIEGQFKLTWERWRRILDVAENAGFQCVFRSDHYSESQPPDHESLETWVSLTYAATYTQRIEFGTLVCPTTFRHPALTARMGAQVDDLSGGRLTLGLGTGWNEREHKQFGIPFYDFSTRFEMLEDALEVTTRLFDSDTPVSYTGKHYTLDGAILLPRPARRTPILIGGNGMNKTLPLVARFADEWNGVYISPADYKGRIDRLNELLDAAGRARTAVKRSLMTRLIYSDDANVVTAKLGKGSADMVIAGSAAQVVDRIGAYAEAGVERFMLQWLDVDDIDPLERFAREVLPQVK